MGGGSRERESDLAKRHTVTQLTHRCTNPYDTVHNTATHTQKKNCQTLHNTHSKTISGTCSLGGCVSCLFIFFWRAKGKRRKEASEKISRESKKKKRKNKNNEKIKKAPEYDSNRKLQIQPKLPTDTTEEFTLFAHRMNTVEDQLVEESKLDPEIAQQTQQRLDNMPLFRFPPQKKEEDSTNNIADDDDEVYVYTKQSVEDQLAAQSKLDPEIAQRTQQQLSNAQLISIIPYNDDNDDEVNRLPKQFVDDQLAERSKLDLGIADYTQHRLDKIPLTKIRQTVAK